MISCLPFLTNEHCYAITNVVARAAQLDATIKLTLNKLLGSSTAAHYLLKNLNGDKYIDLLRAMLDERGVTEATRLTGDIKSARKDRNDLVHWLWGKSDDPTRMKIGSIRPHRETQQKDMTASEVQSIADRLYAHTRTLLELSAKLDEEAPGSWQRIPLPPSPPAYSPGPSEQDP